MNIDKMSDKKCLKTLLGFFENRVEIDTEFLRDPDTGHLTHERIKFTCGNVSAFSHPEPLPSPMLPLTPVVDAATIQ